MGREGRRVVKEHLAVDIVRSRYAALYNVPEPGLPIFTPLDDLRVVSPSDELPDLVYIDAPVPSEADCEAHCEAHC